MESQLTLTELNSLIKETIQLSFPEQLWVVAEIGELKVNRGGHCYMELVEKDNSTDEITARSRATIWSWQYRFIQPYFESTTGQTLQAGLKVLIAVSIEFHEVYGISLNIKDIDPNYTLGDMARKRQEIIKRLEDEGVFDMNKEIPIVEIPSRIAIISSPTAAGYEDFMNQLHNNEAGYRFSTKLFAATMQGSDAVASIISALDQIYELEEQYDAVVIIRGGGSQMDLACFDNYDLAFYITQFPLPIITGIGHEKDESIVDMVANTRLKTPTAVAEFLIGCFDKVAEEISEFEDAFFSQVNELLNRERVRIDHALKLFKPLTKSRLERTEMQLIQLAKSVKPTVNSVIENQHFTLLQLSDHLVQETHQFLKEKATLLQFLSSKKGYISKSRTGKENQLLRERQHRLAQLVNRKLNEETNRLEWLEKTTQLVDPKTILKRGYSITLKNGKAVKDVAELADGDRLETLVFNGKVKSIVEREM